MVLRTDGEVLAASRGQGEQDFSGEPWWHQVRDRGATTFSFARADTEAGSYLGRISVPVFLETGGEPAGFICDTFDVKNLVATLFVQEPLGRAEKLLMIPSPTGPTAAFAFSNDGSVMMLPGVSPSLDEALGKGEGGMGSYEGDTGKRNYVAGFVPLELGDLVGDEPSLKAYVLARRGAGIMSRLAFRTMLIALLAGGVLVAFFCLAAYRLVHNNIVRPVRLLNEGAEIVGHGDLELKLKIDTGDEIEELAASFNRMALDLKRKIHQLEESEEKYRGVVTSMKEGIYRTNADGEIVFLNKAAADILGYRSSEDAIGISMNTLYVEEIDAARMNSELRARGSVDRFRFWMTRKDGQAVCVETSGSLVRDQGGTVVGVEGIFKDVTEEVRLERETKEKAERLAVINEITSAINSSLNVDRVYEAIAVRVRKLVQFDCAGIALQNDTGDGMEVFRLWPITQGEPAEAVTVRADESSGLHQVLESARPLVIEDGKEISGLTDAPRVLGTEVRSCVYLPLFSKEHLTGAFVLGRKNDEAFGRYDIEVLEQIAGQIGVAIDNARLFKNLVRSFEEVKEAQEKLAQAHKELKTLDTMKTNLLSNVSHELRTPLVSIMGYTDMIYREKVGPLNEAQKEYLDISLRNVDKLVSLIENLLDFSRLHRGMEKPVFSMVDLAEVAKSSVQVVRPVADRRKIRVELKAPQEELIVEGDSEKLSQVFDNLLSNAVKFNDNGGSVFVELRKDSANNAEVSVRDTGIGIPREALGKVFTRFYQYDSSSTRKYGGTGIGLSIVQDIVRMHGGRISVTSEVGKGSRFVFALPLAKRKEAWEEERQRALPEMRGLVQLVTKDKALADSVKAQLVTEGINVIHVANRDEAVRLAGKHLPDCVAVDADIDDQGGRSVIERLRHDAYTNRIPIVLITEDGRETECPEAWLAARVAKSYRKGRLLSTINYVIGLSDREVMPRGETILVVDDDPDVTDFLSKVLGREGYEVVCAGSGREALDKMEEGGIGLVLLDIAMPEMDGWEVCRRIRSEPGYGNVYVYVVTAKPEASIAKRVTSSGADGYVIKPFRVEELMDKVNEVVHPTRKLST
jgi:PAS domain S-box-containing protein